MHTPEPWTVSQPQGMYGYEVHSRPYLICMMPHHPEHQKEAEANARRIVACINALAGFSTEDILSGAWRTQIRASEE